VTVQKRFAAFVGVHIGVLRRVEAAVLAFHEAIDEGQHRSCAREVARLVRESIGDRVVLERGRLERHQLLEVRMVPVAGGGVLVDPAPHRIDQLRLLLEREEHLLLRVSVSALGAREHPRVVPAHRRLLRSSPAALILVPVVVELNVGRVLDPQELLFGEWRLRRGS
jgi:hypothetical protein